MADKKQVRQLVKAAEARAGWRVEETKAGWMLYPPDKGQSGDLIHKTPSDHRAWANTIALLRRRGAPVQGRRFREKRMMRDYSVTITIETAEPITIELLESVASIGGAAGGNVGEYRLDTTLTVEADSAADAVAAAVARLALPGSVIAAETMTAEEADRRLAEPAFPELAGASEVAAILGISRQRLGALRERHEFPAPVAQLAAGPVWRKRDLTTFAEGWHRKPGRPKLCA
jgi:hypothetical protein